MIFGNGLDFRPDGTRINPLDYTERSTQGYELQVILDYSVEPTDLDIGKGNKLVELIQARDPKTYLIRKDTLLGVLASNYELIPEKNIFIVGNPVFQVRYLDYLPRTSNTIFAIIATVSFNIEIS